MNDKRVAFQLQVNTVTRDIHEGETSSEIYEKFRGTPSQPLMHEFRGKLMIGGFPDRDRQELEKIVSALAQQTTDRFARRYKICPLCFCRKPDHLPDCAARLAAEWMGSSL